MLGILLLFCFFVVMQNREVIKAAQKALEDEKTRAANALHDLKLEKARNEKLLAAEQKRIAHDLHDDTVQRLVAIRLRLEQLTYLSLPDRALAEVRWMKHELDDTVNTLRYLIKGMVQPKFHEFEFSYLFEQLIQSVSAMHHVKIDCLVKGVEADMDLPPRVKQHLYYIVQEVCHNFLKNSMGFQLQAQLTWHTSLEVKIIDNGRGFLPGRQFGVGMLAMAERARAIRASLVVRQTTEGLVTTITYPAIAQSAHQPIA